MRLSPATLDLLPGEVARFDYDRDAQAIGIVHFGIGAFHRAHQAWYTDLAMSAGERDWAISGVSLRSRAVAEQLVPQSGVYTLTERAGTEERSRVIGSVAEVLFAPNDRARVVDRIAAPECRIVSFTVTEKGYCRDEAGRLDRTLAEANFYPMLGEALALRARQGLPGVTLLSCDNLKDNGDVLHALMRDWLAAEAAEVGAWFEATCTTPSTMVDRIVPRSTTEDLSGLERRLGHADEGAVFTERYSQWVIEDRFAAGRPHWERHGSEMVEDVAPYETAKLRMLNGAHSLLAYCGLRKGYEFMHQAVADPELKGLAERLMTFEAAPSVVTADGQDLAVYADQLLARFADPALRHRLAQIAMDGTQKIPQRWLETALWHLAQGSDVPAIREAFAAWCWHIEDGRFVDDPHGVALRRAAREGKDGVLELCLGRTEAALWPGYRVIRNLLAGA